jgi:hypothetical protein
MRLPWTAPVFRRAALALRKKATTDRKADVLLRPTGPLVYVFMTFLRFLCPEKEAAWP